MFSRTFFGKITVNIFHVVNLLSYQDTVHLILLGVIILTY